MKTDLKLSILFLAVAGTAAGLHAQSTAFTYHGRLNQNGAPVTGAYDMRFAVYDADAVGGLVAGPLSVSALGVTNGLFTARIDFGASVFTGPPRWLEISVRPAGAGNFASLSPRQELTSSPYAIRAQTAGTAADVSNGSVVKSLNNLRDHVTLTAGANVTLTPSGNMLTIHSSGGGAFSLNGNNAYYTAGNVGVGTTQPQGLLDVATGGASDTSALFVRADPSFFGRGGIIHHQSSTYGWQELAQNTGSPTDGLLTFHYVDRIAPGTKVASTVLTLRGNGCVGIGTEAPQTKLTVLSSLYGIEHTDGTVRLGTYVNHLGGWLGTVSNHKLHFFVNDSVPKVTLDTAGNLGIGTQDPGSKLEIVAQDALSIRGFQPFMTMADTSEFGLIDPPRRYFQVVSDDLHFGYRRACNTLPCPGTESHIVIKGNGNVGIGTTTPQARLDVAGAIRSTVLTITGGADIAEPFKMSSAEIPKGSVVVIDEMNPGHLKLSTEAYDTRVAGVVSGANGIKPGISLHQDGAIEGGENVALSGRVYVQADATTGAIKPGDLLTTSDRPGHAMKVHEHAKGQGAVLGKAMTGLKEGLGMVLVLVTLQ